MIFHAIFLWSHFTFTKNIIKTNNFVDDIFFSTFTTTNTVAA